ncbi:MAG TPA: MFS transporter [Bryobacteraceae bacterium]|nr:MFS transporter [Bryobacteraceae bacterium]
MTDSRSLQRALWVLFAVNVLNFYDRSIAGALAEPIRREFDLSDTQIGFLGTAFIWLYAIVGVPIGRLADRFSRKNILGWGVLIWSALTGLNGLAQNFGMLLGARLGVAVGEAACAPTATSWIGDLFPPDKRSRALARFMLGVPVGAALSYFFSGPLAQAYGWRMAMVVAAVPAALLVPLLLRLPEPVRGASETMKEGAAAGSMWRVLRIPTIWWIIASGTLLNFNMYAFGTFLPALFSRVHGLTLAQSGIATGIVYAVGGIGGGLLAGRVGDYVVHKRKDGRLLAAAGFALLTAPFALFGISLPAGSLALAVALIAFAFAGCNTYYGFVYSTIQDIVPPSLRGTTMAIYFMAMYMMGASVGPLLTGHVSDWRAHAAAQAAGSSKVTEQFRAIGLQEGMLMIPLLSLGLAVVLWAGSRTITSDMARRESAAVQAVA